MPDYEVPDFQGNLPAGEHWWEVSENIAEDPSLGYDYWSALLDPFYYSASDDLNYNPYTIMLQNWNAFSPYEDDYGERYRALEQADIGQGLLRSRYRSQDVPSLQRKIGGTGFAASGSRPRKSLYDAYASDWSEIQQESQAALNTVYETFGGNLYDTIGGLGGAFDPYGEQYTDIENRFDFSDFGSDLSFQEGLEACIASYYDEFGAQDASSFVDASQWCAESYGV